LIIIELHSLNYYFQFFQFYLMRYNAKKILIQLVKENRINDAFIVLEKIKKPNQDFQNDISQLSGRFYANEEKRRSETASNEFLKVEHNQILHALLSLINKLDSKTTVAVEYENVPEVKPEPVDEPTKIFKWQHAFLGLIFLSVTYYYCQGENFEKSLEKGKTLMQAGKYDEAMVSFSNAIETSTSDDKNLYLAYTYRANARLKLKNFTGAIEDCTKALSLNNKYDKAFIYRGEAYCKIKDWQNAINDLTQSIALGTTDPSAYYSRGSAQYYKGDYALAIPDFSEALKFNPNKAGEILNARGKAYDKIGNSENACTDFKQSCKSGFTQSCNWVNLHCTFTLEPLPPQ
jgi:tetratricopeptide (TPR) repeat protein